MPLPRRRRRVPVPDPGGNDAHGAVDGRDLQRGAEHGFFQGDGHVGDDVVAVAVEAGVGGDGDLYQCIAGGGAVEAGAALAAQAQDVAVLGAGGDADVQGLAVGQARRRVVPVAASTKLTVSVYCISRPRMR